MKPVTRLFLISTGWTLSMYMASNFVGAWFWDIGTGLRSILVFYAILFIVMVASFGFASKLRGHLSSPTLMGLGIVLNAIYLALLLILQAHTRNYFIPIAIIDGLSSSFYWLSLFVLASTWVEPNQARWYNSWTGTIEAILGLLAPPLSGWIIGAIPGLNGYRVVFFVAFLSLLGCAGLVLSARKIGDSEKNNRFAASGSAERLPSIPQWRRLGIAFWALGMRDGMYFFIPNLLLYIVTKSALLLGEFVAMQAVIEGAVFWGLTHGEDTFIQRHGLIIATLLSLLAMGLFFVPLGATTLFLLGAVIAVSYPSFKVRLESQALTQITHYSRHETDRVQLTGTKEVWINGGRLFTLGFLIVLLSLLGPLHIPDFRWILGFWAIVPVFMYLAIRGVVRDQVPG